MVVRLIDVLIIFCALFVIVSIVPGVVIAQSTTLKLTTTDNTSSFNITNSDDTNIMTVQADGKVGINQPVPSANLDINGTDGFIVTGIFNSGIALNPGAGTRLHWYSPKAAIRAGSVNGTEWNDGNIGPFSAAFGVNNVASGQYSMAMGTGSTASGDGATAFGIESVAGGNGAAALGYFNTANGDFSIALGGGNIASGDGATALGNATTANGNFSTALGVNVSTNNHTGSFIIGDYSPSTTNSDADNQMVMRFANGYQFFTNGNATVGVQVTAGGNSWTSISDSTRKENYLPADGEAFLKSLSELKLGSWNYKGQNPAEHRHYGPMAQEIFAHYGHDGIGIVGCDTLLASADMDGIMMICLKALEKRTSELAEAKEQIAEMQSELEESDTQNSVQDETIRVQAEAIAMLQERLMAMEEKLNAVTAMVSTESGNTLLARAK